MAGAKGSAGRSPSAVSSNSRSRKDDLSQCLIACSGDREIKVVAIYFGMAARKGVTNFRAASAAWSSLIVFLDGIMMVCECTDVC